MKIGLHFNADHEIFTGFYSYPIYDKIFTILLSSRSLNISSKIFVGDLLFSMYASEQIEEKTIENGVSFRYSVNREKYNSLVNNWLYSEENNWKMFVEDRLEENLHQNIFVVCFESIDLKTAEFLFESLSGYEPFIGMMEVVESNPIHWMLYGESLVPYARIINRKLNLFHDSLQSDDKDVEMQKEFKKLGFEKVDFEELKLRYSIFDIYHNYEQARRISEWKKGFGSFLAFVADDVVSKLIDVAPDLGNKLWSALKTFDLSETDEQYAQVIASCRRIFEYVTDCIFPPSDEKSETGNSLKADKYKNRIYEYSKQAKLGSTNIDLITASTETLFEQWSKLNNLANKGVHSEVFRNETRRCLIRTVLLLDDIVSLREDPFEIKPKLDLDI